MTSNKFIKSLLALSLSSALLLAGCWGEIPAQNAGQPDEIDPSETAAEEIATEEVSAEETTAEETTAAPLQLGDRTGECFIAPDPEIDPYNVEFYKSFDCVPGYLYFKKDVFGEITLLLDKKFKELWMIGYFQDENTFWGISEDNELLKVSKIDGSYDVLYTPQYGEVSNFYQSDFVENKNGVGESGRFLYLMDGDYDIVILETSTDEYDIFHSDKKIVKYWWAGFQEDHIHNDFDDAYVCDICGYDGKYVIWEDIDGNYFWYHPETGENEPLARAEDVFIPYFIQVD